MKAGAPSMVSSSASTASGSTNVTVARFTRFGFEWSYEAESPQQLALAILLEHLGDSARAIKLSRPFMQSIIANFDNDWALTGDEIDCAIAEIEGR
jgi:Family of unknown function (DUF6166)